MLLLLTVNKHLYNLLMEDPDLNKTMTDRLRSYFQSFYKDNIDDIDLNKNETFIYEEPYSVDDPITSTKANRDNMVLNLRLMRCNKDNLNKVVVKPILYTTHEQMNRFINFSQIVQEVDVYLDLTTSNILVNAEIIKHRGLSPSTTSIRTINI